VVHTAGQVGFLPGTRELAGDNLVTQTAQTLANLEQALLRGGARLGDVVHVNVMMADLRMRAEMNVVYQAFWPPPLPARTTIGCQLATGVLVEMTALAVILS
jgi:2-iminobutanoate/2-iminopropanoate deaminase